jgi:uncharacterized protein YydD (DUF2326 family)
MNLLSSQRFYRLKANKRAYEHFEKRKETYRRYAQTVLALSKTIPEYKPFENEETRVNIVKEMILALDEDVYGLETTTMSASEIADSYARLVVGHEREEDK